MNISTKKFIPGIAWFFILLFLMCLPGSDVPSVGWLDKIYFDKWVHIGVFALLVTLFCWPFYRSDYSNQQRIILFIKIAIAASIWGIATEFIQKFFVPGREFDIYDWIADTVGAVIAYWFCRKKFMTRS